MKFPPLHTASIYGQFEVVKLIYHFEEDFNRPLFCKKFERLPEWKTDYYEHPIVAAIENGHTEIVKFIANTPQEIQNPSITFFGLPLIYLAVMHKNLELVKFFAPKTQNINQIHGSSFKDSLLHASIKSDFEIFKFLMTIPGIDPNVQDGNGETILQQLCTKRITSKLKVPKEDVMKMIEILAPLSNLRKYPLHQAVSNGSVGIVKILVKYLDANVKDFQGLLPIDHALRRNYPEAFKILAPYTKELRTDYFNMFNSNSKAIDLLKSLIQERNKSRSKEE